MKTLIITIVALFFAAQSVAPAQLLYAAHTHGTYPYENNILLIVWKYASNHVSVCLRESEDMPYDILADLAMHRTYPSGPKVLLGDDRLPCGIHEARVVMDGGVASVEFDARIWPVVHGSRVEWVTETYRIKGPSLDRNTISLIEEDFTWFQEHIADSYAHGVRRATVVIVTSGALEPDVITRLENAKSLPAWQDHDAVYNEIMRWKPLVYYMLHTGLVPELAFEDGKLILPEYEIKEHRYSGVLYK